MTLPPTPELQAMLAPRRYKLDRGDIDSGGQMVVRPDGRYVLHSDYATAIARVIELEAEVARMRAALERALRSTVDEHDILAWRNGARAALEKS